ncbi:DNA cytosine methyltransferase [Fibrivirga algicola]|uniref:DNA (cytosine-5-)-methyltransferase n=1 Tax=Fibrivirga algicola TaxID=2950420 RepID=A0ABX0QAV5_9BACT|nr:DNA cytosine methyltransferase [Fibrivirga algicola]NID09414.1 DNA cytosine methyltransferase [Fibrivirga algicola]
MLHPSDITLTDDFCGCGGSTQGAKHVPGVKVKYARNHWPLAIESHNTNHPDTEHDCVNLSETHPGRYERTTIYIASPECTKHSRAGGRKRKNLGQTDLFKKGSLDPAAIKSRATMWDVVTFAEYHRHEVVIVENVAEIRDWECYGPWIQSMHNLGYLHECVYLNAMFAHSEEMLHFAPQSRNRIYVVFWKKGNRKPNLDIRPKAPCLRCGEVEAIQTWKRGCISKDYGKNGGYFYRCPNCHAEVLPYYYAAVNCIDFSLPMIKIGDRAANGMSKLSANTLARIEYGLKKFGLRPTILDQRNPSGNRIATPADPLHTQTTQKASYLFSPFLLANREGSTPRTMADATHTITTGNHEMLIDIDRTFIPIHRNNSWAAHATDPLLTVSAGGIHSSLVIPPSAILTSRGTRHFGGQTDPMPTQTTSIQNWLMGTAPFLQAYHKSHQAALATDPVSTIPTRDSVTLVESYNQPNVEDCYWRMFQPHETAAAQGFPTDYIILGSKDKQQIQIGNANPPPTMELLVRRCVESLV